MVVGVVVVANGRVGRDRPGPVGEVNVTADAGQALNGTHRETECWGNGRN